ncbi:MAG: YybH family protein [Acidiferrobacter sp.]
MLDRATAEDLAARWIASWNSRDLEHILRLYAEDFVFSSPLIVAIAGEPSGILIGKDAVGAYWRKALARRPDLAFRLESVRWGIQSIVINYSRDDGHGASEWFQLGPGGLIERSSAHYGV